MALNLTNLDIESNFYDDPQLKLIFITEFNSKVSSKIMWALLLVFHPISKFYSLDVDSRKLLVERDFLKKELDWKKYETTIALIQEHLITKTERLLDGWESKLEERDTFMHSLPYNADNFELLDKMLANTAKMWDSYLATKKKAAVEQETSIHGDTELSLSEKGLI